MIYLNHNLIIRLRQIGFCLLFALTTCFALGANAADTNSLVWRTAFDRVSANLHDELLSSLLEDIAQQTGWHVFVEPGTERNTSTKFKDLPSGDALKMLLGDLNFALVPQTNASARLYVFRTTMQNATKPVSVAKPMPRRVPNELLVRVKPGTDIDALAKSLGAKVTGRLDKLGLYRLQFADAAATDAALSQLNSNRDVAAVNYNYYFDQPPPPQTLASAQIPPVNLQLKPPSDSGKVVVGLIDTSVQSLGTDLDKFMLKQVSVAGDAPVDNSTLNHGTAMAETILRSIGMVEQGSSSVQILPVDVYGASPSATTWNVADGIVQAINGGANVINLSLGGTGESSILAGVIQSAQQDGILFFAAAGNDPVSTATYPAAYPGVVAVTAAEQGKIAPYADYGSFVDLAAPDSSVVYLGSQPWFTQGTSVSTANMTGLAAGSADATKQTWAQIMAKLSLLFPVPKK
jgi:hypothetical protein